MRILYVIRSLTIGGAETIAVNYLIELKKCGHDVALLQVVPCNTFLQTRLASENIPIFTAESYLRMSRGRMVKKLSQALGFRHYVKSFAPDIIHVHSGLEKMRFAHFPANRVVFTIHSSFERALQNGKNFRKVFYKLAQNGMKICVLNEQVRADALASIPVANLTVIPNGMDLQAIADTHCDPSTARREFGITTEAFVVGHVGRFHPVKNHEKVISVFAKIREQNSDAILLLLGDGSDAERKHVQELIENAGISDCVRMPGTRKDAVALLDIMDVVLLPSHSEACPLVLIEAQAKGKRAVVSDSVAKEFCVTEGVSRLPVADPDERWAERATQLTEGKPASKSELLALLHDFDIQTAVTKHEDLYAAI